MVKLWVWTMGVLLQRASRQGYLAAGLSRWRPAPR